MPYFYWGEENNPRRKTEDEKSRKREKSLGRGHWETVNPRSIRPMHRAYDERQVRRYESNPNPYRGDDGGVPWVRQGIFGRSVLQNGHHRRQAAINTRQRLRIWVATG